MSTTKTTVREYDNEGRMVKETVTEVDDTVVARWALRCSCGTTAVCPLHGMQWHQPNQIWCSGGLIPTTHTNYVTYNTGALN